MALFNRQDKKDKKKGLESTIGKIIYGFLLFAPLLSILTTCLYVIFNKNAFESYYGETINEEIPIQLQSKNEFKFDEKYYFTGQNTINNTGQVILEGLNRIYASNTIINGNSYGDTRIGFYAENNTTIYFYIRPINEQTLLYSGNFENTVLSFTYENSTFENVVANLIINKFYYITYNKYSYLDNNFEYGIYKTEQSTLFNWSKSTGTYQIMETTTQGLGITNTFIPMLMTYWLLISVIYFIYDIALVLIMMVHKKIHEFQESL